MSDPSKAVFLSYASQDAEAARRICEALRAAGVEVWFDQNELVGGDAWDAKIRKQIAECALFVPVISAATQARREGYFRLEWRIAAQRTHMMSEQIAFLLPVVIDSTRDAEADVPGEFKAVQWTRLASGEASPAFCERVKKLIGGEVAQASPPADSEVARAFQPVGSEDTGWKARATTKRPWLIPAFLGAVAVAVLALWQPWKKSAALPVEAKPAATATPTAPLSEARKLERQARALIDDDPLVVRENFKTAYELCERAVALSPDDGEIWATMARANINLIWYYAENSDQRKAAARSQVERATRLAPQSFEAGLAMATFELQSEENPTAAKARLLRLLKQNPNDRRLLRLLINVEEVHGQDVAEAGRWLARAIALPGGDSLALVQMAWVHWVRNELPELLELLNRSLAIQPTTDAYHLKLMGLYTSGDLAAARSFLQQVPASILREDRVAMIAYEVRLYSREPDAALAVLAGIPREILEEGRYFGLRGHLAGTALQLAGKLRAAEVEFRAALKALDARIAQNSNQPRLMFHRARLLACLGDKAEAARHLDLARELGRSEMVDAQACVLLDRTDEAIATLDKLIDRKRDRWPSALLVMKYHPVYDALQNDSRFHAIVARGDRWLAEMTAASGKNSGTALSPAPDQKSVAVLAFANLSDDKANEYFSDGISEELLNVLAKVPGLKVSARTSAFHFKGKDTPIPEIARQLGVAYVVEGSVRKAGDKVRITAQLIKAADGFHVWSDTFTRDLKDIFAVQDEIAGVVAKNLSLKLGIAAASASSAINPEAYRLYLEGRQEWNRRTMEGYRRAEGLLNRALELEPGFARAHAALADVWSFVAQVTLRVGNYNLRGSPELARITAKAEQALALDPNCAEAHAALSIVQQYAWRMQERERSLRRAIELNPNYASAHQWLGSALSMQGKVDEALQEHRRAAELDPLSHRILDNYSDMLASSGKWVEAEAVLERARALNPTGVQIRCKRLTLLVQTGRRDEALAAARDLLADPETDERDYRLCTVIYAFRTFGQPREAAMLLDRITPDSSERVIALCYLGRTSDVPPLLENLSVGWLESIIYDPIFAPLLALPAFQDWIQKAGLKEALDRVRAWRQMLPIAIPEAKK